MSSANQYVPAQSGEEMQDLGRPSVENSQPKALQGMDPQRPHTETEGRLRGGDRGGPCPGRFCFIIPCPIPCDFCFIPC